MKKIKTKDRILFAALDLFSEKGYDQTSIDLVAEAVWIKGPSIYAHYNGGTGNYNSYLGFNPETGTAVVVLSNLAPNYRVPATVLGVKLLLELDNEKWNFQFVGS